MIEFEDLSQEEKDLLLKAPAYVSLLAANSIRGMDEVEKNSAIEFAHIKTYSSVPMLSDFYAIVERVFLKNIEQLDRQLPKGVDERKYAINKELQKLEPIYIKLGSEYAKALNQSFISYSQHVAKSHRNVFEAFVIPFYIKGLTD